MVETGRSPQEKGYWQKPNNWIRVLTLIAVAIYTGVQIVQTRIISNNNTVSERAFVSIAFRVGGFSYGEKPKAQWSVGDITNALAQGASDVSGLDIIAELTNSGNTGTKNLRFFLKCSPSTERLQEPWSILYQGLNNPEKTPQIWDPMRPLKRLVDSTVIKSGRSPKAIFSPT